MRYRSCFRENADGIFILFACVSTVNHVAFWTEIRKVKQIYPDLILQASLAIISSDTISSNRRWISAWAASNQESARSAGIPESEALER